jgi:hypothetical protein
MEYDNQDVSLVALNFFRLRIYIDMCPMVIVVFYKYRQQLFL